MPTQFKYKALAADGSSKKGALTAENPDQVAEYLAAQDYIPVKITAVRDRHSFSLLGLTSRRDYENLIIFTNNLATMYRSGIPILRALSIIKVGPEDGRFSRAIQQIRYSIQSGKSLSEAMASYDEIFSRVYRDSIAAGEESGRLEDILEELSTMMEKEMELGRQIKSGLRYPIIVVLVIAIAFVVLMTYVIPRFVDFYGAFGAQLPLATRILIGTSNFVTSYWAIILGAIVALGFGLRKVLTNEKGKLWVDTKLLRMPILGDLVLKGNVARFAMMFGILFKAGLPIVQSLNILADSVKNSRVSCEIRRLEEMFRKGSDASLMDEKFDHFPDLAKQMIAIGLETGALERMLGEVGAHYSKEVQYTSRHLTAILEPILTFVVAIFVLIMALAIFLPMWNLIQVFKGG
ncbi:MAG: type II secretion system F family protein [Candidatus Zixiibacteriota bacterium]|nr:MAG: type II secretion system F family protein [candidate division Zixibacteria bacterium]